MADDLATDADYIEACRLAAWMELPLSEVNRYWDAGARKFLLPDGWPNGVEADQYVRGQLAAGHKAATLPEPSPSGPLSPSVRRLREMLR